MESAGFDKGSIICKNILNSPQPSIRAASSNSVGSPLKKLVNIKILVTFATDGTSLAGCCMAVIPTLIVYLLLQKHFVEGIASSGIKG